MRRVRGVRLQLGLGRALLALLLLLGPPAFGQSAKPAPGPAADFVAPGPAVPLPAPVAAAVDGLRSTRLAAHVRFLASPTLEGRALGRPGLKVAEDYVVERLALAGIEPLVGGARPGERYFQAVPLREVTRARGRLTVDTRPGPGGAAWTFPSGADCSFPPVAPQVVSGPVVFAGYGIRETSAGRDDYEGLDVHGKIAVILGGLPEGPAWRGSELVGRYGGKPGRDGYAAKAQIAAALGARAVVGLELGNRGAALARRAAAAPYFLAADGMAADDVPLVLVSGRVADALARAGARREAWTSRTPGSVGGLTLTIAISGDERPLVGRNVAAVIPGRDPRLRDEAVVIGAHLDHLGRSGTKIYPGADDNASGTAALLEMAATMAGSAGRPRRTVVFVFWTGEEEGHLGSEYYVRHPLWPLDRTRVYLNLDMIAHPWLPKEIAKLVQDARLPGGGEFLARVKAADFVEPGVAEWAPGLCATLEQAARGLGLALHFDRTSGKSGGSDYRAFARTGLPFIRFFGNYFPGYHQPSDTADSTDAGQALKVAQLALATAWLLADE